MTRIIVLEGPVGAGKTAISVLLAGVPGISVISETPLGIRGPSMFGTYGWLVSDWLKGRQANAANRACVVDRGWLSTAALRCHERYREWNVARWHARFGYPLTVVLTVDPVLGLRRKGRQIVIGHPFADPTIITSQQHWIATTLQKFRLPHLNLNATSASVQECAARVLEMLSLTPTGQPQW